jgi:pimeloyl-ACP methyl ester carboxylesterase
MATEPKTTERRIAPTFDRRGNPEWRSTMTPPDNSVAVVNMIPDRVIPVIFVPGVMGSNLVQRGGSDKPVRWRMDGANSAKAWAGPSRGAEFRKQYLQPDRMEVDREGWVTDKLPLPQEELRRRGWGEVGAMSYAPFLEWLETHLNDFDNPQNGERVGLTRNGLQALAGEAVLTRDEVALSYKYRFPVYACGYNWLDDNAASARRLAERIGEIRQRYRSEGKKCDKVIIVTHSMGGLVARHCSEVLGKRDEIFGIVHGVMPAIGAAAVYRRFKSGTEDTTAWYNAKGAVVASVLGNDAAEMTAVLSSAPGPLQLLPTPEYGNGWLTVWDGPTQYSLPKAGDPYGEIYAVRGKWWSMCEDHLVNPLNQETEPKRKQVQMDADWNLFEYLIVRKVKVFHSSIAGKYHPNSHAFFGSHNDHRAYGTVTWRQRTGRTIVSQSRVMDGTLADLDETGESRTITVMAPASGNTRGVAPGTLVKQERTYHISQPDEAGDGTVPHRSGVAPRASVKAFLQVNVEHEPAYKHGDGADNLRACRFTLRAIVRIAQAVQQTSLRYE